MTNRHFPKHKLSELEAKRSFYAHVHSRAQKEVDKPITFWHKIIGEDRSDHLFKATQALARLEKINQEIDKLTR